MRGSGVSMERGASTFVPLCAAVLVAVAAAAFVARIRQQQLQCGASAAQSSARLYRQTL